MAAAAIWSGKAMFKGQVLTGGRGKAGAIRAVSSEAEAESAAKEILAMSVKGCPVQQVLVTERLDIRAEYYAAIACLRNPEEYTADELAAILSSAPDMLIYWKCLKMMMTRMQSF